ncbi:MAG: Holliday junction resolvase RuvX [Oscillospiraceae bacterium]|nr:Holliday junction resolvase RuvX [Oscillospiraceae bacterium]
MARVMAVDYGDRRTGVAVSDGLRSLVGDCFVIDEPHSGQLANRLEQEYAARGADTLVLGNPINMNGTEGPRAEKTAKLKLMLERRGLRVVLRDERRTTAEAESILTETGVRGVKRKGKVDAVAASLILEGFLFAERVAASRPSSLAAPGSAEEEFPEADYGREDAKPGP